MSSENIAYFNHSDINSFTTGIEKLSSHESIHLLSFSDGVRDAAGGHDTVEEQLLSLRRHPPLNAGWQMTEGQPCSL